MKNPNIKKVTSYLVHVKGTKLLPRQTYEFKADQIARNSHGDIILRRKGKVVGSWNRENVIGVYQKNIIKSIDKTKAKKKIETPNVTTEFRPE